MLPDHLLTALPLAEVLSGESPVAAGFAIIIAVAIGGWMVDRHRIGVLERSWGKHEDTTHKLVNDKFAEIDKAQRASEADCAARFADLQRQVDRSAATRSDVWQRDALHDEPTPAPRRSKP
jgi:hypothetical protein